MSRRAKTDQNRSNSDLNIIVQCWGGGRYKSNAFVCVFIFILKWECTAGGLQVYSAFRWVCRWVCPSHPSFMGEVCGVAGLWSVWCLSMQELLWQEHCFISLLYVCISMYLYIHLYTPVYLLLYLCTEVHVYLYLKISVQRSVSAGFTLGFQV